MLDALIHIWYIPLVIGEIDERIFFMPKRTFQPKKRHAKKKHGFRKRISSPGGRAVLKRRKLKGRKRLSK